MRLIKAVSSFFIISLSAFNSAAADINVDINGKLHVFNEPIKLADALSHIEHPELVYWPDAGLFLASEQTVQQKHALMTRLINQLALLPAQSSEKAQLADFIAWLSGIRVARRIDLPVEFERARHVRKSNPLLQEGLFYLRASYVQPQVLLLGAVTKYQADISADSIAQAHELHHNFAADAADNSWAYWSVSGAEWHKVGIAYWNKQQIELAAGAMLYFPFSSSVLGGDSEEINQQIIMLLRNWVR